MRRSGTLRPSEYDGSLVGGPGHSRYARAPALVVHALATVGAPTVIWAPFHDGRTAEERVQLRLDADHLVSADDDEPVFPRKHVRF